MHLWNHSCHSYFTLHAPSNRSWELIQKENLLYCDDAVSGIDFCVQHSTLQKDKEANTKGIKDGV